MNGSQSPDRHLDRRPDHNLTEARGWRFAVGRRLTNRRQPTPNRAPGAAWLLLRDGRPALGISRPG